MSISPYLTKLRKKLKLSQREMSELLDISLSQVRNLEKGRTEMPRFGVFQKIVNLSGDDIRDAAYNCFFGDTEKSNAKQFNETNARYLSNKWVNGSEINPFISIIGYNKREIYFDGAFWYPSSMFGKVLIGNYHKEKYVSAIKDNNDICGLIEVIYSESSFIENIPDEESIAEVRFVLDNNSEDDRHVFDKISRITFSNLGNKVDISYVLFDSVSAKKNQELKKHYVTKRRSSLDI